MSFTKKDLRDIEDIIANGIGHNFAGEYDWDLELKLSGDKVIATIIIEKFKGEE